MDTLQTVLEDIRIRMQTSYNDALATIKDAMLEGYNECVFSRTDDHRLIADNTIHSLVANMLIDARFTVTSSQSCYTVSGWNKVL